MRKIEIKDEYPLYIEIERDLKQNIEKAAFKELENFKKLTDNDGESFTGYFLYKNKIYEASVYFGIVRQKQEYGMPTYRYEGIDEVVFNGEYDINLPIFDGMIKTWNDLILENCL